MILTKDLKPGDILVVYHNNEPYHAAIYAPNPGEIGDIVHTCSGFYNSGVRRGTLAGMYQLHLGLNNAGNWWNWSQSRHQLSVQVYRNIELGETIAQQARFWMQQGVRYDEKRLMETIAYDELHGEEYSEQNERAIIFEYLKYAARRETYPIKAPYFPNHASSFLAGLGSFTMAPSLNLPASLVEGGKTMIRKGTQQPQLAKGFTCAGFVLACVGAAALRDEIGTVSEQTGWVSVKYGHRTEIQNSYNEALNDLPQSSKITRLGLHRLLTQEQQNNFDLERLRTKLAFLTKLHPHRLSLKAMSKELEKLSLADRENTSSWQKIGELGNIPLTTHVDGRSKPFNKKDYRQEKSNDNQQRLQNHQEFCKKFGHTAFALDYKPSFSQRLIELLTGEKISIMNYSTFKYFRKEYGQLTDEEIRILYIHQIRMEAEIYLNQHWILSMLVLQLELGFMVKYCAESLYEKITHYQAILNYLKNPQNVEHIQLNAIQDDTGTAEFYQQYCQI